ncbi:MAG TPA: UvrD-helicase domain-containing protein [Chitinophagales bacterium]|nr:UvrD-helicase domain-containing protein [Chitinophagales bacterium]
MIIQELLNKENIDPNVLQKGLKFIGLDLSKFENINENQIPEVIELFKQTLDVDPHKTTKFKKLEIRTKLEKIIKRQKNSISNTEVGNNSQILKPIVTSIKKNTILQEPILSNNIMLGKVKFFDYNVNNFGILTNITNGNECHISLDSVVISPLSDNEIVVYKESKSPNGRFKAFNVNKHIPVFIFNSETSGVSYAYPLLSNYIDKKIQLIRKEQTGFANVKAINRALNWDIEIIDSDNIKKADKTFYGKKILLTLLSDLLEYKTAIVKLLVILREDFKEGELEELFSGIFQKVEEKDLIEINKELLSLKDISYFNVYCEERKKTLNKISFLLWAAGELENLPNPNNPTEIAVWHTEILSTLSWEKLQQVILKLLNEKGAETLIEDSFKYLLEDGWQISSLKELDSVVLFIKEYTEKYPDTKLSDSNFTFNDSNFYIILHKEGILEKIPEAILKEHISSFKSDEEKAAFIEEFSENKILEYYALFPELSIYQDKYMENLLHNDFSKIDFLCFDIESDRNTIAEFAWQTNILGKNNTDYENIGDGILDLVNQINSGKLIVGHNIKEFDLPILQQYNADANIDFIWDTFEIEMLISTQRFSYGLKTAHNAIADTNLTLQLFKNQVLRIITAPNNFAVYEVLPAKVLNIINRLKENPNWNLLNIEYLQSRSNIFFRPNPTYQNIADSTLSKLQESINDIGNKIIIAPEFLWNTLDHQFNLRFNDFGKSLNLILSKVKIEANINDNNLLKFTLLNFISDCFNKNKKPYYRQLPIAIQIKIKEQDAILICDNDTDKNNPLCINPANIDKIEEQLITSTNTKIIIIGTELYNLTNKIQLGEDFDFSTIFDRLKNESIWLQMSGGKSYISLDKRHCELLGISEYPKYLMNIWLEKIGRGKFKIWCNTNFDKNINGLGLVAENIVFINWTEETTNKENAGILRPDTKKSGYIAEHKRVNPESLYRKSYWTYQFKILKGFDKSLNPKVLILNDDLESEKLISYARRLGYFIPDTKATLARQVELLHTHKSKNKILFTTFQNLDKVIACNYSGAIDFIWDSFLLQEKSQILKGKFEKNLSISEDENEDNLQTNSIAKDNSTFSLIKLHKPLFDYYYNLIIDNNPESHFFLCDSRLADYFGIEKSLNINVKSNNVQMWYSEDEYKLDIEIANEFFGSYHENTDVKFNVEEAKEILRQIFLKSNDNNITYHWHDYQQPCLNDILPAVKDLLISLPTGAGKSILFQGPALFRAAFSNKLSIVISPLRALMHDQVVGLWNKGFYSNVEFLSADKSQVEIKDIYRRITGGEITLLYITPERFRSRSFENCLLSRLDADSGLEFVVFDEAHCISQWGQEFRPDYLNAGKKIADYSKNYNLKKLLFSATISEQVFDEISTIMPGIVTVEGAAKTYNPVRDHIKMDFKHNIIEDERLNEIALYLKAGKFNPELSRAIVFVKSRKKAEECAVIMSDTLKEVFGNGCNFLEKIGVFHAGMEAEDRKDTYEKFNEGDIVLLFATKAFGMGMDIPNIHFVTHYSPPGTFEDFLQEIGRAGRNEEKRLIAGYNNDENPIRTLCLTAPNDFGNLKDQLLKSRISWHEIKEIKMVLEEYIKRFKPLVNNDISPAAVPFNLYSVSSGKVDEMLDNKFRIALHWLERLNRIKLGYFTITHLEIKAALVKTLNDKIINFPDKDIEKACRAILILTSNADLENEVVQVSIISLRSISKLSHDKLFSALIRAHNICFIKLMQEVLIEPTKLRANEINYCRTKFQNDKYPVLKTIFAYANKILDSVNANSSKSFEGEELDDWLKEVVNKNINFKRIPWSQKENTEAQNKEYNTYINDIIRKRSKHAFTIIRLLGKTKHETKMDKIADSNRKVIIRQSVFNGYNKKEEWINKIQKLEKDCINLLDNIGKKFFDRNIKSFNWADIILELDIKDNIQYLSDLLFILSVLGYTKTNSLLPSGIEVYINSTEQIDELAIQSDDNKIYEEFDQTRKIRELKLIALQVLSGLDKNKHDNFIRKYFECNSLESLLKLLQDELPPNDPMLIKWRGDAIKTEEDKLNIEQRKVYDADINQHINVMAGPGSGKTHTLTLRVAKLIHHIGVMPEEILVLAYNRAVVSELKDRLGRLFNDLGYGSLAKRIKIFTFHGLAKKYCFELVKEKPFNEWEKILLKQLNNAPGQIINEIGQLRHILVDEFQDINKVRIQLLESFYKLTKASLFIIGDPNQSIYGYERIDAGGSMSPWPYYTEFSNTFKPKLFYLFDNHRSYADILSTASQVLSLRPEHKHLIPRPTKVPDEQFIKNYVEIIDARQTQTSWEINLYKLLKERIGKEQTPYKQIAILFRTNNEVYNGFQKVKKLNLPVRIRIQGSLPYEFTRIRECHAVIMYLQKKSVANIPTDFKKTFDLFIKELLNKNKNWNDFYVKILHALVLEFLDEQDETQLFENLIDYIVEITMRDDGQLYKIYEKHIKEVSDTTDETEIVLTTMHKVKGLEFDAVIIPPSYTNLLNGRTSSNDSMDQLEEERRLTFVAYTRAKYRLIIYRGNREFALLNNTGYAIPINTNSILGIPVSPEIKKLKIGWAAKSYNYNNGVNNYINTTIKSGDFISIKKRIVPYNGSQFTVHEILKEGSNKPIGELSRNADFTSNYSNISGFVVNEIVVWTYDDTCKFDLENNTNYANDWCQEAKNQGYIYLVDFAGFGIPDN